MGFGNSKIVHGLWLVDERAGLHQSIAAIGLADGIADAQFAHRYPFTHGRIERMVGRGDDDFMTAVLFLPPPGLVMIAPMMWPLSTSPPCCLPLLTGTCLIAYNLC